MGGPIAASSPTLDFENVRYGQAGYKGLIREPYILSLACFASIGGFLFGYDQGAISSVLVMPSFERIFPLLSSDATLQGWMVSVLTLGAMFGALINGPICDRFSRRWSLLYATIVFNIGSILQAAAYNISMIFVGRCIAGIAIGMLSMVVPLYLLVAMQQLGITLGICFAFCPRWLINQGREDEALATLVRVRRVELGDRRISMEILEMKAARLFDNETIVAKYGTTASRFSVAIRECRDLFTVKHLYKRTIIACLLQVVQQFTGINAIIYYAPQIFQKIGLQGNSVDLLATGVVGIIDVVATIPAIMFLDRWGRRPVLMAGAVGMGISQLIVGTLYAVYNHSWAGNTSAGWATAAFVWIYIGNFAWSIGCVNWIVPSEIMPPGIRGKAVGLAIATNWLSNFIVALITPRMLKSIESGTFYFFLAFCVLLFLWVFFAVPETRRVPLEEMDALFGGNEGDKDMQRMAQIRRSLIDAEVNGTECQGNEEKSSQVDQDGKASYVEQRSASSASISPNRCRVRASISIKVRSNLPAIHWHNIAVHFGDAYTLKDVYKVAKDQNVIVVDGGTSTVGALNGCVLGSGHGPESRYYGFGADQVLEAQVVLFDGYVVTANPCEKLNLFWAIRSGGPGTYGLVIPITVKAYPMASVQVQHLAMAPLPESDSDDLLDAIAILYAAYPDSNDGGYAGYGSWMLNSTTPVSANFTTGYVHGFYAFDSDLSTVQSIFAPTLERLESFNTTSLYISLDYVSYPTYWDFFHAESGVEPAVGVPAAMGSRLFSRSSVQDDHVSLRRMIAVIAGLPEENTSNNFELVSGGINFQRPADYSGVNPAWRKSYFSNIVSRGWALDASEAVVQSVYDDVVFTKQAAMEAQAPDTGAYMNEASWVDPNYEKNFYGEHYDALSEIKGKRDPCGEFYCKTCVGSDAWAEDSEGRLCQVHNRRTGKWSE
ncbi:general substrate transporter [Hortaea werneckii]|nr:general substrate transporter [Hortaea werneckii]KAI7023463.1 general substrate transporter [Hortaea werneckii]KAI7674223.1 general substrate transporter [Hortaea werneckii]